MDDDAFEGLTFDDDFNVGDTGAENVDPDAAKGDGVATTAARAMEFGSAASLFRTDRAPGHDPMDWHMQLGDSELARKRKRMADVEEAVSAISAKLLEAKRRRKSGVGADANGVLPAGLAGDDEQNLPVPKLLNYPPITGVGWVGVSSPATMERGYLSHRIWRHRAPKGAVELAQEVDHQFGDLLETLRNEFRQGQRQQAEEPSTDGVKVDEEVVHVEAAEKSNALWLDKYAPRHFMDLLSDDEANRLAVVWLKLWDFYVFGKRFKTELLSEKEQKLLEVEDKKPHLPKLKMLLLHGPSGCGKTVLASVAARQAGYNPFIINLNEVANVADLTRRMSEMSENRTINQMWQATDHSKRSNCVILEGVEHAGPDIGRFLVGLVTGKAAKGQRRLPIICSCNNLYTPSLKDLRNHCFTVKIPSCDRQRIAKRLEKICSSEGIDTKRNVLLELADQCHCDVRLSVNTLQFTYTGANRPNGTSNASHSKMTEQSIFEALETVLMLDRHMDRRGILKSAKERSEAVQHMMSRRDDLDRFYVTLFHNVYDHSKVSSSKFRYIGDQFVQADLNASFAMSTQSFFMFKYQSFPATKVHLMVAVQFARRLVLNVTSTVHEKRTESHQIIQTVRGAAGKSFGRFTERDLVLSVVPQLPAIISPPIQPPTAQVYGANDQVKIARVVGVMSYFGLTYVTKFEDGVADLRLDPAIDMLAALPGSGVKLNAVGSITKRHIARQVEISRIKGDHSASADGGKRPDFKVPVAPSKAARILRRSNPNNAHFIFTYHAGTFQVVQKTMSIHTLFFK